MSGARPAKCTTPPLTWPSRNASPAAPGARAAWTGSGCSARKSSTPEGSDRQDGLLSHPASGVILAGGQSRRMGREKLSIEVGGLPLIEHVNNALSGSCQEVLVVGGGIVALEGVRHVADERPGRQGPLAGIEAGLAAATLRPRLRRRR